CALPISAILSLEGICLIFATHCSTMTKEEPTTTEKVLDESQQGSTLALQARQGNHRKLYIESYGCQMNFSDSEIVASILVKEGFNTTQELGEADLVLVNTCSIRDKAEQTIRKRLEKFNAVKRNNPKMKVGVLGCMAERLKKIGKRRVGKERRSR